VQSSPLDAAHIPIASKNVSTGIPLSTRICLNTVSVVCGACARTDTTPSKQTIAAPVAQKTGRVEPNFMLPASLMT
jgi:hypothetical protein